MGSLLLWGHPVSLKDEISFLSNLWSNKFFITLLNVGSTTKLQLWLTKSLTKVIFAVKVLGLNIAAPYKNNYVHMLCNPSFFNVSDIGSMQTTVRFQSFGDYVLVDNYYLDVWKNNRNTRFSSFIFVPTINRGKKTNKNNKNLMSRNRININSILKASLALTVAFLSTGLTHSPFGC